MELILLLMFVVVCRGNLLERGYLPPPGAKTAGGSPGAIDVPLETPRNNVPSKSMQAASRREHTNYGFPPLFESEVVPNITQKLLKITTSSPLENIQCNGCRAGNGSPSTSRTSGKPNTFTHSEPTIVDSVNIPNTKLPQINLIDSYPQSNNTSKSVSILAPKTEQSGRYNYEPGAPTIKQSTSPGFDEDHFRDDDVPLDEFGHVSSQKNFQEPHRSRYTPTSLSKATQDGEDLSPHLRHDDGSLPSTNNFNNPSSFPSADSYPTTDSRLPMDSNKFSRPGFDGNAKLRSFGPDSNRSGPNQESATSRPSSTSGGDAVILNYDNIITPEGGYSYSFDTSNGIHADESGNAADGVKAQGTFSYSGDDGQLYTVTYTADENGFRPRGEHLPTPPPVPEAIQRVVEQSARDEAEGIVPDQGFYDESKYGFRKYHQEPGRKKISKTKSSKQQSRPLQNYITSGRSPSGSVTESSFNHNIVTDTPPKITKGIGSSDNDLSNLSTFPRTPVINELSRVPFNSKASYQQNNGFVANIPNGQVVENLYSNHGIVSSIPSGSFDQRYFNQDDRQPISTYRSSGFNKGNFKQNIEGQSPIRSQFDYEGRNLNTEFMLKPINGPSRISVITTTRPTVYPNLTQVLKQEKDTPTYSNRARLIAKSGNTPHLPTMTDIYEPEINRYQIKANQNLQNLIREGSSNKQINSISSGYHYNAPNQQSGPQTSNMKLFQAPSTTTSTTLGYSEVNEDGTTSMQSGNKHGRPLPGSIELFNIPGEFENLTTEIPLNEEEHNLKENQNFDDFLPDIKFQDIQHSKPNEGYPATSKQSTINRGSFRYQQTSGTTPRPSLIKEFMQTVPLIQSSHQDSTYPMTESDRSVSRPISQEIYPTYNSETTPSEFKQPELFQKTLSIIEPTASQQNAMQVRGNVSPKRIEGTDELGNRKIPQAIPDKMPSYGYVQNETFTDTTENPYPQVIEQTTPQSSNIYNPLNKGNFNFIKKVATSRPHQIQPYEPNKETQIDRLGTNFQSPTTRPYQNRQPIFSIKPFPNRFNQQSTIRPELYYDSTTKNDGAGTNEQGYYSTSLPELNTGYIYHNPNQSLNGEFGKSEDREMGIPGNDRKTSGFTQPFVESPTQNLQRDEALFYPTTSENPPTEYSTKEPALLEQYTIQSVGNQNYPARGHDPHQSTTETPEAFRRTFDSLEGLGKKPSKLKGEEFSPSRLPPRYDPETGYHY